MKCDDVIKDCDEFERSRSNKTRLNQEMAIRVLLQLQEEDFRVGLGREAEKDEIREL